MSWRSRWRARRRKKLMGRLPAPAPEWSDTIYFAQDKTILRCDLVIENALLRDTDHRALVADSIASSAAAAVRHAVKERMA